MRVVAQFIAVFAIAGCTGTTIQPGNSEYWQIHYLRNSGWFNSSYSIVLNSHGNVVHYSNKGTLKFPSCATLNDKHLKRINDKRLAFWAEFGEEGYRASGPCEDIGDETIIFSHRNRTTEFSTSRLKISECPEHISRVALDVISELRELTKREYGECIASAA